jgi:hypothetical protein
MSGGSGDGAVNSLLALVLLLAFAFGVWLIMYGFAH